MGMAVSRKLFYFFPLSSVVVLAALLYPRESALTNILLSAPLGMFYSWFGLGMLLAIVRAAPASHRLGWTLLSSAPIAILLQRLPAPL
jgi:hypothetical protein